MIKADELLNLSNNQRLVQIISQSGLSMAVALTIFNRGLGVAADTADAWAAYQVDPKSTRFCYLTDEQLKHAEIVFALIIKKRSSIHGKKKGSVTLVAKGRD